MKQSLLVALILTLSYTYSGAVEPWPFVCEKHQVEPFTSSQYVYASDSNGYPAIFIDTKTVLIHPKNSLVSLDSVWIASEEGKAATLNDLGNNTRKKEYGYEKDWITIDYDAMRFSLKSITYYTCQGEIIEHHIPTPEWNEIVPGSTVDEILDTLKKNYSI